MRRKRMPRAAACACLLAAVVAVAGAVPADFARVFAGLAPERRTQLETQAELWNSWSRAERERFAARAAAFDALPPGERRERRLHWEAWRRLDVDERMQLRQTAARIAAMDASRQQALRQQFAALDVTTQRGWMLGPVLGADHPRLQPLLAYVPLEQHEGLLRSLRAMTPVQRADLAVLVQRTPPTARDDLRRALISTSDANRDAWLRLSLER